MTNSDSIFFKGLMEFDRASGCVHYTFFHTVYAPHSMNHQTFRFKGSGENPRLAMKNAWEKMVIKYPELAELVRG